MKWLTEAGDGAIRRVGVVALLVGVVVVLSGCAAGRELAACVGDAVERRDVVGIVKSVTECSIDFLRGKEAPEVPSIEREFAEQDPRVGIW